MNNSSFPAILDRHFKMNQDYLLDLVLDLFDQERKLELVPDFYFSVQEGELNPRMRTKLVEWMIQLSDELKLGYKTKQMAVLITDIVLSKLKIHKRYLQLLGITSLFIVVKAEESFIYTLAHACEHCANAYDKDEVSRMEMLILKTLKWKIQYPTAGEIARRLVQLTNSELNVNLHKLYLKLDNFVDLVISEFDSSTYSPTCIAAAAVMCSFEDSLVHVEKWRKLLMENFQLEFEGKIDNLYQSIAQKLLRYYPGSFNFPDIVAKPEVVISTEYGASDSNTNDRIYVHPDQAHLYAGYPGISQNEQQHLENTASQEQHIDNGSHQVEYNNGNQQHHQVVDNFGNIVYIDPNCGQFNNGPYQEQLDNHNNGTQNVCVMDEENF